MREMGYAGAEVARFLGVTTSSAGKNRGDVDQNIQSFISLLGSGICQRRKSLWGLNY